MKTICIIALFLLPSHIIADGCRVPRMSVSSDVPPYREILSSVNSFFGNIGTYYAPLYSDYRINLTGNFSCYYQLTHIKIYKDGILLLDADTSCYAYSAKLSAFPGQYRVYLEWTGGMPSPFDWTFEIVENPTEIPSFSQEQGFICYSDPNSNKIMLHCESEEISTVTISSPEGRLLFESRESHREWQIASDGFRPGIYYLRAILRGRTVIKKVLIL